MQSTPEDRNPPFRKGVEQLIENGDLKEVAMQEFEEWVHSMHTGRIREFAEAWLTDDVRHKTEGMPYSISAEGRDTFVNKYNEVITQFYGAPETSMVFEVDKCTQVGERKLSLLVSVRTTGRRVLKERIRVEITFTEKFQVCNAVMAYIPTPRKYNERKPGITPQDDDSTSAVQRPTFTRPCCHNYWDSVRARNSTALLRCRTCVSQWKVPASEIKKCRRYLTEQGCSLGASCNFLHINAKKKTFEDRI